MGCIGLPCTNGLTEQEPESREGFSVFPNLASGPFTISLPEGGAFTRDDVIELLDNTGRLLRRWQPTAGSSSYSCRPGGIAAGAYLIRHRHNNHSAAYPLVIR